MYGVATELARLATSAGGHGEFDMFTAVSLLTNFVLFFGFLFIKLRPVVKNALVDRREQMGVRLREAEEKQKVAKAKLAEYREKLENLELEVQRVVKGYEAEAEAEVSKLREETAKSIERLERETELTIEQEMRKAEKIIRDAAASATLETAEQLVKARITDADRRRLADQYVSQLEQNI